MAYTNGLNNLQHFISTVPTTPVTETKRSDSSTTNPTHVPVQHTTVSPDHAKLSSTSHLVSQALSGSDVRTEKVEALQSAIAAGTYHVSSTDLAGKLVDVLRG